MKASAHNQSLVERVPALADVLMICKIVHPLRRAEVQEGLCEGLNSYPEDKGGGARRRDLRGIDLPFPLYLQFPASFSCHPSGCCGVCLSVFLLSLLLLIRSPRGVDLRGHHWKHGAPFPSGAVFFSFCLTGSFCGLTLLQI